MEFDQISARLLSHLPRITAGGPVTLSDGALRIGPEGVSIGDIAGMIADLSGEDSFIPEGMPLRDITLRDLVLERSEMSEHGFDLRFTIAWEATDLTIAPGFPLRMAAAEVEWSNGRLIADAKCSVQIDDMVIDAKLSLPAQVIEASLTPAEYHSAAPFLAARGLVADQASHTLKRFSLLASIPFRRLVLHIELQDVFHFGPVALTHAAAELALGPSADALALDAEGTLEIEVSASRKVQLDLSGAVDAQGWALAGRLVLPHRRFTLGTLVAQMTGGKVRVPPVIKSMKLSEIAAQIDTHQRSFALECHIDWTGSEAQLVLHLNGAQNAVTASATLTLGGMVFNVALETGQVTILAGSAVIPAGGTLTLDALLQAVGLDAAQALGQGGTGIDITAHALGVALDKDAKLLIAAHVEAGVDLSRLGELPLLGTLMPQGERLGLVIKPYYLSPGFADPDAAKQALPGDLALPSGALSDGMNLAAELHLGGPPQPLPSVSLGGTAHAASPAKPAAPAAAPPPDGLAWTDIGKSLGPLTVDRVGWALGDQNSSLEIAFDAALSLGGLSLSVDGLGAKYTFDTRALEPHLQGLGIDFRKGPVALSGAFLNLDGDFAGQVMIGTPKFSLSALGAFKMIDGAPSAFIFGVLGMPLGGPPFFFVDGLAAGFGIHRQVHMPPIEEVRSFPLIAAAEQTSTNAPVDSDPGAQLTALHRYIEPKLGAYFLAAGIKFNSFRLLNGNLVAIVSFGRDFEVDLLGTANYETPPAEMRQGAPALARVELDLKARFAPSEGLVAVEARLNPKSYVYGPLCHLSGGFAFYSWLTGPHAGDFVLSLGGYSRHYTPEPHYPAVPRLELKYQVTPDIYLKGNAFFAMTPAVMMAGGGIHMNAKIGSAEAWGDFTLDMMVQWQPFHYDAWLHMGVGAKWKCFHTSASVDLYVGGPQFHGRATVDWSAISFDIEFGTSHFALPTWISMDAFQRNFLSYDGTQSSLDGLLGIVISNGQVGAVGDDADKIAVVSGAEVVIETNARVPICEVTLGGVSQGPADTSFGIAPVSMTALLSVHDIEITRDGSPVTDSFIIEGETRTGFPPALWGRAFKPDKQARPIEGVAGLRLRPRTPLRQVTSDGIKLSDLRYDPNPPRVVLPAAPRAVAGPQDIAPSSAPPLAHPRLDLVLLDHGDKRIAVIKKIREVSGIGLRAAVALADTGGVILEGLTAEEWAAHNMTFAGLGASLEQAVSQTQPDLSAPPPAMPPLDGLPGPAPGNAHLRLTKLGPNKVAVIKKIKPIAGLGLKEAKEVAESLGLVLVDAPLGEATRGKAQLEALGAELDLIVQSTGPAAPVPEGPVPEGPVSATLPMTLPKADLRKLGLDPDALSVAPLRSRRMLVTLGQAANLNPNQGGRDGLG